MLPAYEMNSAKVFARATRYVVYFSLGPVSEDNPIGHYDLHLPSLIKQQLNAARRRLRNVFSSGLSEVTEHLVRTKPCQCCPVAHFGYERALMKIDAWPVHKVINTTNLEFLIGRLRQFDYTVPATCCKNHRANISYKKEVANDANEVKDYFHGLCLDCMNNRLPKLSDSDLDYWFSEYISSSRQYDGKCRITHGEPTWYFSFNARREVLVKIIEIKAGIARTIKRDAAIARLKEIIRNMGL